MSFLSFFFNKWLIGGLLSFFVGKKLFDALPDETKKQITDALKILNEREAMVAQLYYVEELNVYEIAKVLDITTGRVSQIKKNAVSRLRDFINKIG